MSFALEKPNATTNQIATKVNGAVEAVVTSASDGSCSVTRHIPAADNQPTNYQIEAIYNGDNALNLTLYGKTPDNTLCALCTMLQYYGYKPSTATATLTVEPQTTLLLMANKTPEQIQQEAMQNGTLSFWHEWSWWFPWYRMHFVCTYSGATAFDIGISLLPFGNTLQCMEWFMQTIISLLPKVSWKIVAGLATAEFLSLLASTSGAALILASLTTFSLKIVSTSLAWNSIEDLISVWFGILIPTVVSLVKNSLWDLFQTILDLMMAAKSLAEIGFGKLYSLISTTMNIAFLAHILQRLDELGAF